MSLRHIAVCFVSISLCGGLFSRVGAQALHEENELKNFFVVTHVVSDASPFRYEYIVDVKPEERSVLVREIRIAPGNSGCPGTVTVKAVNRLITSSNPRKVARIDLCSMNAEDVASAIRDAQPRAVTSIDDTASYSIVLLCGKMTKVFELPYPETVDFKLLKKTSPRVASLWSLASDISRLAFGKNFSFYNASPSKDAAFQALGAEVVPAMRSGIYDRGFAAGSHLETLLSDYSGTKEEGDPWYVELVGPAVPELARYQLPKYPPLARQARLTGEVHLVAMLDTRNGLVKDIRVKSGNPVLSDAAVRAVRDWQFRQGNPPNDSVEIIMRFGFRCP